MKTIRQKGFTVTELMVAMLAGIILLLATGVAMSIGHKNWNEAWKRVNLQRDAAYAILKISQPIKKATSAELDNEGKAVTIYSSHGQTRFSFANQSLECQTGDSTPQTILNGQVEDVTFTVQGKLLQIDLRLKKDDIQKHFVSTVMMRNYGG